MPKLFIKRAKIEGLLSGVVPHLVDDGLSILYYADDTILFMDHNLEQTHNMKTILCAFEQLWGLEINFHKSEIFLLWRGKELRKSVHGAVWLQSRIFPNPILRHSDSL